MPTESKIHRYTFKGAAGYYVYANDFDRVVAERDALQQRLTAADQKNDDLAFQLNDTEQSRRDWFEAAQAAEKQLAYAVDALNEVVKASAMYERPFEIATLAIGELSASADPSEGGAA